MFIVDENGNITLTQGDSGELVINGLPTDKNYTLYFAIQDEKRNNIGGEISVGSLKSSSIAFALTSSLTDLLTVPKDEHCKIYYYGVKLCDDDGHEDTLLLGSSKAGDRTTITVYPKQVEGVF